MSIFVLFTCYVSGDLCYSLGISLSVIFFLNCVPSWQFTWLLNSVVSWFSIAVWVIKKLPPKLGLVYVNSLSPSAVFIRQGLSQHWHSRCPGAEPAPGHLLCQCWLMDTKIDADNLCICIYYKNIFMDLYSCYICFYMYEITFMLGDNELKMINGIQSWWMSARAICYHWKLMVWLQGWCTWYNSVLRCVIFMLKIYLMPNYTTILLITYFGQQVFVCRQWLATMHLN